MRHRTSSTTIHYEKMKAITDIKNEIGKMSIEIAEKILTQELSQKEKQQELVDKCLKEININ